MEGQYLEENVLEAKIPQYKITINDLGTADTYNETEILNKYLSYDEIARNLICKAAIQLAIVGYGNKNYGFIRIDEKNVINLVDLFKKISN